MPLVEANLSSGIRSAMATALASSEALAGSTLSEINEAAPGIIDTLATSCGSAMESYLNGMIDFTADSVVPVNGSLCKQFFTDLFQFRDYTGSNHPSIAQAAADAIWASMFPFTFQINTPPPGGAVEITAVSVAPTALGDIAGAYDTFDEDTFASVIAAAVHDGASSIQVVVNYLLATQGTPPAPPLVGGVS